MSLFESGIRPAVDKWLLDKSKEERDYGDYWSASSAGYCMRKLIFERLGVPPVTEDARKQRVFSAGDIFHQWMQDITKQAGLSIAQELELQDEDLMIRGHIDDLVLVPNPHVVVTDNAKLARGKAVYDDPQHTHLILYDYKGLDITTPILTENGWKTMGTLGLADRVFDGDGNLVNIKHKSEIHNRRCYKIFFDTGESIVCDDEHRWLVAVTPFSGGGSGNKKPKEKVMTAQELVDASLRGVVRVLNALPINTAKRKLPINPYVLGVWLADGDSRDGRICNTNSTVWDEIRSRGYEVGNNIAGADRAETRTVKGIRGKLKELNLLGKKHLPEVYLLSDYEDRLELLQGLMDGDGSWNIARRRCVMNTTKEWQRDATVSLIGSLGWKPTVSTYITSGFGKPTQVWRIDFLPINSVSAFRARNKDATYPSKYLKNNVRYIKEVMETSSRPTQCIEVDSPTHTYLAGTGLIKTHNTQNSRAFSYKRPEMSHYHRLQLASYMLMLRKLGEVNNKNWEYNTKSYEDSHIQKVSTKDLTEARILKISKDDLRMSEEQLLWTPKLEKEIYEYWSTLNGYWKSRKMPKCTCADYEGGFMAKEAYNPFYYQGEPCSIGWYEHAKKTELIKK